jgi:nicotinamidase-related amidase
MDDLGHDYTRAGFSARLGFGRRAALVVVDVCEAYLDPASPLYAGVEDVVASCARVVAAARRADVPVLWTRVVPDLSSAFARKVPALELFSGPLGEFPPSCAPQGEEAVIAKQGASAFFGTDLDARLRRLDVDTVVLVGLSTSGCVRASGVDAVQLGYAPVVVREAVGDRDPRPHEQALFDLDAKYADVVSEADVVAHLERTTA